MSASSSRDLWAMERAVDVLEIINQAMSFEMHGYAPSLGISLRVVVERWPCPVYQCRRAFTIDDLTPLIVSTSGVL